MATVSTRIDDHVKLEAEKIADEIGIPLSTAINIFLKRFISEKGFPFLVTVRSAPEPVFDEKYLDASVKNAISVGDDMPLSRQFTYLDPITHKPITVKREA